MLNIYTFFLLLMLPQWVVAQTVNIGVLAYNGKPQALKRWQPTANYLSEHIKGQSFEIVPLTLDEFEHSINKESIDFVLTNPSHYVRLEVRYGATRMATFLSRGHNQTLNQISAALIVRADSGIKTFNDLIGKRLAAVKETAFGGFQLAQYELQKHHINVHKQLSIKWMGFPHADMVRAVLNKQADVATVRSGVLEHMAQQGEIKLSDFNVIGQREVSQFPYLRSFDLYPEWPIAKLPKTNNELAKQVAIQLLKMPQDHLAALLSNGAGWTIPLNYSSVHHVLKALKAEPYEKVPFNLEDVWNNYAAWIVMVLILLLLSVVFALSFYRAKQKLLLAKKSLETHQDDLQHMVQQRTAELELSNMDLQQEILQHIEAQNTLDKGCEVLQEIHAIFIRDDLSRVQRLSFMVDALRLYLGFEYALLLSVDNDTFVECCSSPSNVQMPLPLSESMVRQAMQQQQVFCRDDDPNWALYMACPIFSASKILCVLELASSTIGEDQLSQDSRLSQKILYLITQWLGVESQMMQEEEYQAIKQQNLLLKLQELTPREKQVVKLLVAGGSNKSMAKDLHLSVKTIEMHRANALRKTQSKTSAQLIQLAVQSGKF